jgi:diacylglycerol kinase (ATP)
MAKRNQAGFRRVVLAAGYSLRGLRLAWRHEAAFRQEVALGIPMMVAGLWLGQTALERLLLAGSVMVVWIVELLNSAVEAAIDRIGSDSHELSGQAKDMGSAAVLLSLLLCGLTWALLLGPRLLAA